MQLTYLVLRQWRKHPGRCALSVVSLAVAVAAVLATLMARDHVRSGFAALSSAGAGEPTLEIVAAAGGRFAHAEPWDLTGVPGVRDQIPTLSRAGMARVNGRRIRAVVVGVPAAQARQGGALDVTAGKPVTSVGDVVLAAPLATSVGAEVGARLTLLTRRGPRSFTIVGLADPSDLDALSPGAQLAVALPALQESFALEDQVDRVRVTLADEPPRDEIQSAIAARLPAGFVVQAPPGPLVLAEAIVHSSELALQFANALSLTMAAFIVFNSLRMNFGERRKEMATLRVLGATDRQIGCLYLTEGAALGLLGALAGAPLGILLARSLSRAMSALAGVATPPQTIEPMSVLAACAGGTAAASVASLFPAIWSHGIAPREALEGAPPPPPDGFPWRTTLAGAICWLASAALMALVVAERVSPNYAIPAGLGILVGFIALMPAAIGPIVTASAHLAGAVVGVQAELAARQVLRRRDRSGLTVGIMIVAISNGLGLGNAVLTNVDEVRQWHRRTMAGDAFLFDPNPAASPGAAGALAEELRSLPSAGRVTPIHYLSGRAQGLPIVCMIRDFSADRELPWDVGDQQEPRIRAALAEGDAVMTPLLARKLSLAVGDTIRLELRGRMHAARVAALVNDYNAGGLVVGLDRGPASAVFDLGGPEVYLLQARQGRTPQALSEELAPIASEHGMSFRSFADLQRQVDGLINGVVGSLWGLMAVGFVVAALAVANTLNLSFLEQTRDLGLLRILGLTRWQMGQVVVAESVFLAIAALLFGVLAGLTTAWIIHLCSGPLLGYEPPFRVFGGLIAANMLGCLLVVLLAACPAGLRAQRLNLVEAIAYE